MVSRQREGAGEVVSGREEPGRVYKNHDRSLETRRWGVNSFIWSTQKALFSGTILRDPGVPIILAEKT